METALTPLSTYFEFMLSQFHFLNIIYHLTCCSSQFFFFCIIMFQSLYYNFEGIVHFSYSCRVFCFSVYSFSSLYTTPICFFGLLCFTLFIYLFRMKNSLQHLLSDKSGGDKPFQTLSGKNYLSFIFKGQLCWVHFSWLAAHHLQHFEYVVLVSPGLYDLLH